jgi:putative flippase GtrA
MQQTERLPAAATRALNLGVRFQKFLVVGAVGLAVNQGLLLLLVSQAGMRVIQASPIAILVSMAVTFALNETWTWHDRGAGRLLHRALCYLAINSGGLLINWGLLVWLHHAGVPYQFANLIGAGVAAVWNFGLNHAITWRARR